MTTLNKFNNKDLLRDIRVGVLNPMVDATNNNTLDINTLRGSVAGISKRLGFIEPEVSTNSKNLTALNRFAQAVAQQVSMTYDKSRVDPGNKLITFTAVGGTEKTLDLSPMFVDPIQTKIDISALENNPGVVHSVHQVNFKGNVSLSMDTTDRNRGDVFIPFLRGKIGNKSSNVTKVELTGNTKLCGIEKGVLTINLPEPGSGGAGGLFLEPNPPEAGKNLFKADTQALAEQARDNYFNANPTDLATYKNNTLKAILVEWTSGTDVQLMFQCQHNGNWENPFDIVFTSFIIGKHSINELRDGNRVSTLESETLIEATSVGDGTAIYQKKDGRNLQFRKVRSNSPDLVVSANETGDHEVVFHTKPYWAGFFTSPTEASTNIPEADRIANKTTILTQNIHSEHALHVWDGNNWVDKNIAEHGDISEDGGTNWLTLKGITNGDNITITKVPVSGGSYYHKINAISPVFAQISGKASERITTIEVANTFAEVQGATLKLPVVSAIDANSGDLGQIKNIKQGDNIEFDMDSTGVLVIKADKTDPITATVGSIATPVQISKIEDPSTFSTIDGGTLKLHRMDVVNQDGSSAGLIKSIKAGDNITLVRDSGGTLTLNSSGGGGGITHIQAKTGKEGSTYAPVTKIDVLSPFSEITDSTLTVNSINCQDASGTEQGFIKTLKAGPNITLSYSNDNLNKGVVTISSTGGGAGGTSLQGKVTGGNFVNQYLPITKIDVTTDSNLSRLTKNDGEDTYTMSFDTRSFVASSTTFEGLKTAFPMSTNAYRHGYAGTVKEMYFTDGAEWFLQNYKGMPEQVISLNARYPEQQNNLPGNYDPNKKDSGLYYVSKEQCPIKPEGQKEYGMIENITVSPSKRAQFFWGMETGNLWYRRMDPTKTTGNEDDFLEWNMINGLSDDHFSILTVPSIIVDAGRGEVNGNKPLPWMVIQDPRCNASVDSANTQHFRVNRTGVYDITICGHITAAPDTTTEAVNVGADYTYTLTNHTTGHMFGTPKTIKGVKVPASRAFNKGMYPPVSTSFLKVPMKAGDLYKITLNQSRNAGLTDIYLDSFKNYLVIQPSASSTKQGVVIAESLRTSLGGFSSKPGYEVHVEGVKNNPSYVRVFGSIINDKLVTG